LLNMATLTTITNYEGEIISYRNVWTTFVERHVCEGEFCSIESKSKKGFEKGDMHIVIIIESTTIVSLILPFQLELVPMSFHMDSIRKFKRSIQIWRSTTIVVIIIGVKGVKDSKGEK
jgi:hypothetical protein